MIIGTKKKMSLKYQTMIWSAGLIILFFVQWLIGVLLVRMSGYEDAGVFALAMTISNVFAYFANYGIRGYQVSGELYSFTDKQYLIARLLTVMVSIVLCCSYLLFAQNYTDDETMAILLYLGYNSVNTISDTMQGSLQIRGQLEIGGYSNALRGLFCLIFFMGGFLLTEKLIFALCMMLAGTLLITMVYDLPRYLAVLQKEESSLKNDLNTAVQLLKICFPLMLSQTIPILTTAIPRRAIQAIFGADMLGIYSSIFAPAVIILTLIPAIVTALLPRISKEWNSSEIISFQKWVWIGIALIPLVCAVSGIGVLLFGELILKLLFGESILSYSSLLYWAVIVAVFGGAVSYYNGLLTVMRRLKVIALFTVVALVFTIVFTHFAVRAYGIYGATYLQLAAYAIQLGLQVIVVVMLVRKRRNA